MKEASVLWRSRTGVSELTTRGSFKMGSFVEEFEQGRVVAVNNPNEVVKQRRSSWGSACRLGISELQCTMRGVSVLKVRVESEARRTLRRESSEKPVAPPLKVDALREFPIARTV